MDIGLAHINKYPKSRYYDGLRCRFLGADDPQMLKLTKNTKDGLNLFAYCNNDPVNGTDPTGGFSSSVIKDIFDRLKVFIQKKINYIIKEKLGISKRGNYLYLRRSTVATAINIGITVGNAISAAIKSTAIKAAYRAA